HQKGEGTNINIPLLEGSPDLSYQSAFSKIAIPAIESFNPDLIAVSAGYDAHFTDPLGDMNIDSRTYWFIASEIQKLSRSLDMMGSFWVLEGGYNPLALGPCIRATFDGLQGNPLCELEDQEDRVIDENVVRSNKRLTQKILTRIAPFI
ncbi:MAG: hypothetical protein ACFFD3_08735, partial [Candidatus Thorarchaeota archaeon]